MTYFCFIESSILSVPHMEPLAAEALADARREAETLLDQHASGYAAHIVEDQHLLATIRRADRGALYGRRFSPMKAGASPRRPPRPGQAGGVA